MKAGRVVPRFEVDEKGNCSLCGGIHFGTGRNCVFTDDQARRIREQTEENPSIPLEGTVS